ncbi:MAG: amidohydrolase [Bacteroidales bacterium]|nr:amidohydrolase [Bacteroidales bacterium]
MKIPNDQLNQIIALRKDLHKNPELSGVEIETAKKIKAFLKLCSADEIIEDVGGHGLIAIYESRIPGKSILLRADMDALPIPEINDFEHHSVNAFVSHKCGHDGHLVILAGVAQQLRSNPPEKGRVILLFQPAEETGEGAVTVINDSKFKDLQIDFVFALHNLPGFRKNSIIIRKQHFAAASKGMIIKLSGKTSHAANPEQGISPALAISEIISKFSGLSNAREGFDAFKLITIIHARLGERAFGTSPGYAEVMATLRSYSNDDMELLTNKAINIVEQIADKYGLHEKIEWTEQFPASVNDDECVDLVRTVAVENKFPVREMAEPFRWSEDFGQFLSRHPGALFGVGAGKNHPSLHNPDYDFPDEIIKTGIAMFYGIIKKVGEME